MSGLTRSVIVGIAGGSASGKSTLAAKLSEILATGETPLSCQVIGMDRYFRTDDPAAPRFRFSAIEEEVFNFNDIESTDNERLAEELDSLSVGENRPDVIVVEGLMIFAAAALRQRCDLKVFIELEDDIRLARRLLRDMKSTRRFTEPEQIVRYYLESARVGHARFVEPSRVCADLTVRGDSDWDEIGAMLVAVIKERRSLAGAKP